MGIKQFKKLKGFTLVELIAVVAIISMIAVYITIEISQSSDDAKVGIATAFLASNVPAAISSYRARNRSSCRGLGSGTAVDITTILVARGLAPNSPWDVPWSATYNDTTRQISVIITTSGEQQNDSASTIATNLNDAEVPQVVSATSSTNTATVVYSCS